MKKAVIIICGVFLIYACSSEDPEFEILNIEETETKKELSEDVSGEDLLRYFSRNINCSHNQTVLIPLGDSVRILGKGTDVKMSINNNQIDSVFWATHDWMKSQSITHEGEQKYYVKTSDLLPDESVIKKYFPNDYSILKQLKPREGFNIARKRFGKDFYYTNGAGVYFKEMNQGSYFSKSEFKHLLDSLKENN
jgi:hypothetical protein